MKTFLRPADLPVVSIQPDFRLAVPSAFEDEKRVSPYGDTLIVIFGYQAPTVASS